MSLTNITPSTGERRPVSLNLNALRVEPGDHVVFWSVKRDGPGGVEIGHVQAAASSDGNHWIIDSEPVFVTAIYAKLPRDVTEEKAEAIRADFAAFGRQIITGWERMGVRDRHGV